MKSSKLKIQNCRLLFCILHFAFCIYAVCAQSTDQGFPTAVTAGEISGQIRARDIGDSRSTAYFYTFNAAQGDVFINVVTANFNGDIDVFTVEGLKTLTKIVVYADAPNNETGRVIYLRKPEKLLLRIEGRSPNDDAATFRIKFAGSFLATAATDQSEQPQLPEISAQNDSGIVVNSVGTIISVKPKPTPAPKEAVAEKAAEKESEKGIVKEISIETATEKEIVAETLTPEPEKTESEKAEITQTNVETAAQVAAANEPKEPEYSDRLKVIITDNLPEKDKTATPAETEKEPTAIETPEIKKEKPIETTETTETTPAKTKKPTEPNPLEKVRLILVFKDGTKIERPMSEVSRVNVDNKGMLTVVSEDGTIGRYSILEIAKFTIE